MEPVRSHTFAIQKDEFSLTESAKQVRKIREDKSYIPWKGVEEIRIQNLLRNTYAHRLMKELGVVKIQSHPHKNLAVLLHGEKLSAHGVEQAKGGLVSFLNIIMTGLIATFDHGGLGDGNRSLMAGPHGPFYVIVDPKLIEKEVDTSIRTQQMMIDEKYHVAYLVPTDGDRTILLKAITKAQEVGMITPAEQKKIDAMSITYDTFLHLSKEQVQSAAALRHALLNPL